MGTLALEGARIVGPCGPTGTSRASRGRSIGVRARQTTDPSSSSSSSADDLTPEFVKNARTRRPKVADVIRNPKKFVADVGASIPTGTSRIIDEKVRDVVIPVNALDPLYREYTSEQLRAKTDEFRARLKKETPSTISESRRSPWSARRRGANSTCDTSTCKSWAARCCTRGASARWRRVRERRSGGHPPRVS